MFSWSDITKGHLVMGGQRSRKWPFFRKSTFLPITKQPLCRFRIVIYHSKGHHMPYQMAPKSSKSKNRFWVMAKKLNFWPFWGHFQDSITRSYFIRFARNLVSERRILRRFRITHHDVWSKWLLHIENWLWKNWTWWNFRTFFEHGR